MAYPSLAHSGLTHNSAGEPLHWGRMAAERGLPLVGVTGPMTDDEADRRLVRSGRYHLRRFDLNNPTDRVDYAELMTRAVNRLYSIVRETPLPDNVTDVHWVEWALRPVAPDDRPTRPTDPYRSQT